jgi:hypothetical protein
MIFLNIALVFDWDRLDKDKVNKKDIFLYK